ncbi:general secretion pathway protein C [Paraburkholderia unamae]|uniref:general secretion pathway protein GspC n=1 Tax=Paraburkholderia unamae TaxID=219649 RepID=UPI000DC3FBCA|nr:general secretion pathway protein GspC [Paraburkholderia unamae]RAR66791.1 general secretion pathway protein C [Paraburkholderia unamae]
MNPLQIRLLSLAAFAVFCATATWWAITLATSRGAPVQAAAAHAPVSLDQAATLFGGKLERNPVQDIHLFGILALSRGAAAILSVGGEPPKAVSLGGPVDQNSTLAEVRPRSIVIDRHGVHSEIFLPPNAAGPTIYMR